MNIARFFGLKSLVIGAMLLVAGRAQALYTPELTAVSNGIAMYVTTLTLPDDRAEIRVATKALKALSRPSKSVADDYRRFLTASIQLGPYALQEPYSSAGSNVFAFFMGAAGLQFQDTSLRLAALNPFVRTRKAASNHLAQAYALFLANAAETNVQTALLRGQSIFNRLVVAARLVAIGERHQGNAANSLEDGILDYTERGGSGDIVFDDEDDATVEHAGDAPQPATYTYTRTGLNTGTLVLTYGDGGTDTVKLRFSTTGTGRYTRRYVLLPDRESASGRFVFTAGM